jgi:hypothetical protein
MAILTLMLVILFLYFTDISPRLVPVRRGVIYGMFPISLGLQYT